MKDILKNLFKRLDSFTPNASGLVWFRLRYEEPEKIQQILTKLSMHSPIALRWRMKGVEQRCYLGLDAGATATLIKMAKELGFTLEDAPEPPDALTDRFSMSDTLFTLGTKQKAAQSLSDIEMSVTQLIGHEDSDPPEGDAFALDENLSFIMDSEGDFADVDLNCVQVAEGDGWIYKGVLFAHDEAGKTKKLTLPKETGPVWTLPSPTLGTRVNPEWPTGLTTHSEMFWEKKDWLLGRTKRHEMIGGRHIQLYGDDAYTYPWLAALVAAREKQGIRTLVLDGEGGFLEHLYTEGRSFNDIHKMDVDGKTHVSLNPLTPIMGLGRRDVEATETKWLTWFRALGAPQSVEHLISKAAADESVYTLETLLVWLSNQAGKTYTDATNLKNFILAWDEDPVTWLQGEGNQAEAVLSAGRALWVKCPFKNLRSRRGIYVSVLMAAAKLPDVSIVLHKVPVDVADIPGLADKFLVIRDDEMLSDGATKVITRSEDIDLLTGMEMISGEQIKGVPEYIRQLGEFEAIAVQPNDDALMTGGDRFHITRMSWF